MPSQGLPIELAVDEIRRCLASGDSVVVEAEPGAGKSTILPLHLLDEEWLGADSVLMLEPRRLAARSIARRMAELLGERLGHTVGLVTRDDREVSAATRLIVMTEGVLTNRIQRDPELSGVGLVIFDEFHERNLQADLGLALMLEAQRELRPDVRIITMSATIDTAAVAELMGDATVVSVPGRTFPVETRWRPRTRKTPIERSVAEALASLRSEPGDVLVFLPGAAEIHRAIRECGPIVDRFDEQTTLVPLYGGLSIEDQDRALLASKPGHRKVVFSTDIAETSLTVEGVRCVIDSGLARKPQFDANTGMARLLTVTTSRASADQRAGRAGRTEPGIGVRLWSKVEQATRLAFSPAEIANADLADFVLELAAWGIDDPSQLALLDPPPAGAMAQATDLLEMLGLIDDDGRPTDLGSRATELGAHPRLARMILGADDPWLACVCAALIEERDVIRGRRDSVPADMWTRIELVADSRREHPQADGRAIKAVRRRARQLLGRVGGTETTLGPAEVGAHLALAYPDRVAQARGSAGNFRLRNGAGAWVQRDDPLGSEPFIVAVDLDGKRKNAQVRLAASVDPDSLVEFADVKTTRELFWDENRNDLYTRTESTLGALRFSGFDDRPAASPEVTAALIDRIRVSELSLLNWSTRARALQKRLCFLADRRDGWPDVSDEALLERVEQWLTPYLGGATRRSDIESIDVAMLLQGELGFDQFGELNELAPTTLDLPGGGPIPIDYSDEPRISVRPQRLFGITDHPKVMAGAVPLVIELLSPADRPIQVTTDLAGFWTGSWVEVRKEMTGRYPKHDWPVNPGER